MATASPILGSKILIVDDLAANVQVLKSMLQRAGYPHVTSTMDSTTVCALHRENRYDLILLDLQMPQMDGFQVMAALSESDAQYYPSILVITAQPAHKLRAMQAGARDFINKPFDHSEVLTRIHYILEVRLLQKQAEDHSKYLEKTVLERTAELQRTESMFRELVANIPEALWIRDVDRQTIQYANPAWQKLSGVSAAAGDSVDKAFRAVHPDDLTWIANERRQMHEGQANNEYRLVRPDDSVRWVQARQFAIPNPHGSSPWIAEIIEDVTQRRETQRQLVHSARHDALTDLANRTHLYDSLRDAVARAEKEHKVVSVLLIDIDYFKTINDTLGHAMGDSLLRAFAARLAGYVRPGDVVGRLGGDEFAVVVSSPVEGFCASTIAGRIHRALQSPMLLDSQNILVTTSMGVASYPIDTSDFDRLIHYADTAMYEAKVAGRNTFRCYNAEMKERAIRKSDIERALRLALERDEFVLHYQPKMSIDGTRLTSVEALLRWNRPGHGCVLPREFIPLLEEMGLIVPVGAWVIRAACRQIRKWQVAGLGWIRVAVNVSSKQVRDDMFVAQVVDAAREQGIVSSLLEFELTESALMAHGEATDATLCRLKNLGHTIAIDDFGTGYSNLAYLKRFDVDALKIDITFIRDITANADSATITVAIINMAHNLRLKVVAEGVETLEQLDFLRLHGCDEIQGNYFSEPLSEEQFFAKYSPAALYDAELATGGLRSVCSA